jgi:ribonuclease BN (tRNA processing enzyme)
MRIKVLGCSGAIAKDYRTTSFLLDHNVLIDAGTGVGDLSIDEMCLIDDVFLTHSHLDHILLLPLMLDSVGSLRRKPLRVHALTETLATLKKHIFNNLIWPDFSIIPSATDPYLTFHEVELGGIYAVGGKTIEVLSAVHAVPAVGYAVASMPKNGEKPAYWVFSGDTERNPDFWKRVNKINVGMMVIETTFSNTEKLLALRSRHLCAEVLLQELHLIEQKNSYPIYITHAKPGVIDAVMREVEFLNNFPHLIGAAVENGTAPTLTVDVQHVDYLTKPQTQANQQENRLHPIAWLAAGQEFEI